MPLLEAVGTIALRFVGPVILLAVVLLIVKRLGGDKVIEAVSHPPEPPAPASPCELCELPATRPAPRIVEHRPALERARVRWTLPVQLVPTSYRRSAGKGASTLCDLHGAIADHLVDAYLEGQRLELAKFLRDGAIRTARFAREELQTALELQRSVGRTPANPAIPMLDAPRS